MENNKDIILEDNINNLKEIRDRIIEKMKLHGIFGESIISDINDSGAIPLGLYNSNVLFNFDSIFYDVSPINNPDLNDEEKRIEFLCCGLLYDKRVSYKICENSTRFKIHYVPINENGVRPGKGLIGCARKIVVHETRLGLDYASSDRTSAYYEKSIDNNNYNDKRVGYHFLCDADKIICFIPWNEISFHASSEFYNYRSIGIERIVTKEAGTASLFNQAKLIATLMYMENIPINRVITHFDATYIRRYMEGNDKFNTKSCPDRLLNGKYGGMYIFKQVIINCLRSGDLYVKELENIKKDYVDMDNLYLKQRIKNGM